MKESVKQLLEERKGLVGEFSARIMDRLYGWVDEGKVPTADEILTSRIPETLGRDVFHSDINLYWYRNQRRLRQDPSLAASVEYTSFYTRIVTHAAWSQITEDAVRNRHTSPDLEKLHRITYLLETPIFPLLNDAERTETATKLVRGGINTAIDSYIAYVGLAEFLGPTKGLSEQQVLEAADNYSLSAKLAHFGPAAIEPINSLPQQYKNLAAMGIFFLSKRPNGKYVLDIDDEMWVKHVMTLNTHRSRLEGACPALRPLVATGAEINSSAIDFQTAIRGSQKFFFNNLGLVRSNIDWNDPKKAIPKPDTFKYWKEELRQFAKGLGYLAAFGTKQFIEAIQFE